MNKEIKSIITRSLVSGFIFALFMEAFKLLNGDTFNIWRTLLHFVVFGAAMGYGKYKNNRLKTERDEEKARKNPTDK